jgi:hypothetical protein
VRKLALRLGGLALLVSACAGSPQSTPAPLVAPLPANPAHGHWVRRDENPVLICDLSYYPGPSSTNCLRPRVFLRRLSRTDAMPAAVVPFTSTPVIVRKLETVRDPAGRLWQLFFAVENGAEDPSHDPCLEVSHGSSYWGGLCASGSKLVSPMPYTDWIMVSQVIVGVAGDATSQVRIVDAHGRSHRVEVSSGGFIYFCPHSCGCDVAAVVGLAALQPPVVDDLRDPKTHRLYWCAH